MLSQRFCISVNFRPSVPCVLTSVNRSLQLLVWVAVRFRSGDSGTLRGPSVVAVLISGCPEARVEFVLACVLTAAWNTWMYRGQTAGSKWIRHGVPTGKPAQRPPLPWTCESPPTMAARPSLPRAHPPSPHHTLILAASAASGRAARLQQRLQRSRDVLRPLPEASAELHGFGLAFIVVRAHEPAKPMR